MDNDQSGWLAEIGALLADRSRSAVLMLLMDGRAYTATELARAADVTPQTASHHLQRLEAAHVISRVRQGRHSYFRIANDDVAGFIERILAAQAVLGPAPVTSACPERLRAARSCYGHLAGQCGVRLFEHALAQEWFVHDGERVALGRNGMALNDILGLDVAALPPAHRAGRVCLDWSERRFHAGGRLGAALLAAMLERRWFLRRAKRELVPTEAGRRQMAKWLA